MCDDSDYQTFLRTSYFVGAPVLAHFFIRDAEKVEKSSQLQPVAEDLARELGSIRQPLAVFVIATPQAAELPYLDQLPKGILDYRLKHTQEPTFVYKIIFGWGFTDMDYEDTDDHFSAPEIRSRQLGGIHLSFNEDYPTVCCGRLVEYMLRVLGHDLPGNEFPNYTPDEVEKIAWNIRRESFNAFSTMQGAIPKYPIVDGRPKFPF